ncbi:hypothetical protein ILUMI_18365 [Ignelater luminosus]|uniref:Uncharacterized protein n=1 Tax=Ignelater luminosus TaxID=2038154 RepID=A0A8K0CNR0_IGNLU|nr:hypothetical protein ILUMI_18365 [Ignelater luminosus]
MLGTVFPYAFSTKNIVSGFKAAEIFPLDWNLFTDGDLCSSVTDRTMLENGISFPVSNSNECLNKTFSDPQPSTSSHDSMPEEASVCICSAEVNNHAEINKLPAHNNLSPSDSVGFHGQRIVTPKNDSIVSLVDTDDEDSANEECIFCHQPYNQDCSGT